MTPLSLGGIGRCRSGVGFAATGFTGEQQTDIAFAKERYF